MRRPQREGMTGITAVLAFSMSCSSCAAPGPDPLACPDLPPPDLDLQSDAMPDPSACFALPEIRKYLEEWRVALLESWEPPQTRGKPRVVGVVLSMSEKGEVARYCIRPGGARHLRRSVIQALEEFVPPTEPSESIAACLAHRRISGDFRSGNPR